MASLKLGALVIKTLSKPLGNYIKRRAAESESFKNICVSVAQNYNHVQHTLTRTLSARNGGPIPEVRPLKVDRAVSKGADTLSEIVIFSAAAIVIIYEGLRASNKSSSRKLHVDDSLAKLIEINQDMLEVLDRLEQKVVLLDPAHHQQDGESTVSELRQKWMTFMRGDVDHKEYHGVHHQYQILFSPHSATTLDFPRQDAAAEEIEARVALSNELFHHR